METPKNTLTVEHPNNYITLIKRTPYTYILASEIFNWNLKSLFSETQNFISH